MPFDASFEEIFCILVGLLVKKSPLPINGRIH
jgi:hypothetical protein